MKLVTWNTQACTGLDGRTSAQRIVEQARALADFDVLCLQEVADNFPGVTGGAAEDQPTLLARLLPGFRVAFGAAVQRFDAAGAPCRFGNLIATRLPVAQVQHHALPWPADPGAPSQPRMCTVATVVAPRLGAVRVMTTHLEFYTRHQRLAQARALRDLHEEYCAHARTPARVADEGTPTGPVRHTAHAVLCGDFNCQPGTPEYAAIVQPGASGGWHDAWPLVHGATPHPPTFCVHEQRYMPKPVSFDFVFVSATLRGAVARLDVDGSTLASDHQPVLVEFG